MDMELKTYLLSKGRGSLSSLAKQIGAHAPDLSCWSSKKKPIPPFRCVDIEKATKGKVTRRDLRPDDWRQIWPELVKSKMHN
jgi:DNA-binding transcriptional regulator YdaS (Cro superfamily)